MSAGPNGAARCGCDKYARTHACRVARNSRRSISGCCWGRCQCRNRRGLCDCLCAVPSACVRSVRLSQLGKTWGSLGRIACARRWLVRRLPRTPCARVQQRAFPRLLASLFPWCVVVIWRDVVLQTRSLFLGLCVSLSRCLSPFRIYTLKV